MRLLSNLATVVAAVMIGPSSLAAEFVPLPNRITVNVKQGDWGTAQTKDIRTVLAFVADVLLPYFPQHASDKLLVAYSRRGPQVLFEKSADGARLVYLNVQDTRWDQFTYQFSHELCHIFTNYEHREISRNEGSNVEVLHQRRRRCAECARDAHRAAINVYRNQRCAGRLCNVQSQCRRVGAALRTDAWTCRDWFDVGRVGSTGTNQSNDQRDLLQNSGTSDSHHGCSHRSSTQGRGRIITGRS